MSSRRARPLRFKVMTYNIHKGVQGYSRKQVLTELRQAIRDVSADIVFLQEVQGGPSANQFEFLADSVWTHFAYGKNAVYGDGHHGNAILSKYPISGWENLNISTNRLERRGVLHAIVHVPKRRKEIHLLCLHLNLLERGRRKQIDRIIQRIAEHVPKSSPLILAGDFNDWREKASEALIDQLGLEEVGMANSGEHVRTFPAWLPILPLDRIYFRGLRLVDCETLSGSPWRKLSDHQALTADFAL